MIKTVHKKQIVFYSPRYAMKEKNDRAAVLRKAKDLIRNPAKYNKSTSYGSTKYMKNLTFDSNAGKILESARQSLMFDEEKLCEEEKFYGYYTIITNGYKE